MAALVQFKVKMVSSDAPGISTAEALSVGADEADFPLTVSLVGSDDTNLVSALAEGCPSSCFVSVAGDEVQLGRFSCSVTSPSSTAVNSPVCTMPFLFSKESFNCSFNLSNFYCALTELVSNL